MTAAADPSRERFEWDGGENIQFEGEDMSLTVGFSPRRSTETNLVLLKAPEFVQRYIDHFKTFEAKNMVEVGLYQGGSTVFFWHLLPLKRLVGIELEAGAPVLDRFIERRGLGEEIRTYYGTSQDDRARLTEIMASEFGNEPIDLVIDDASHMYPQTRDTFEILFPLLRPGGQHIIEDWRAFSLLRNHAEKPFENVIMHKLIAEIVLLNAARPDIISAIKINPKFVAIERGPAELDPGTFAIEKLARSEGFPAFTISMQDNRPG
ncbi:MAG: class I SAM-dependent methyltransferase [Pseudomonadota bacterium]